MWEVSLHMGKNVNKDGSSQFLCFLLASDFGFSPGSYCLCNQTFFQLKFLHVMPPRKEIHFGNAALWSN